MEIRTFSGSILRIPGLPPRAAEYGQFGSCRVFATGSSRPLSQEMIGLQYAPWPIVARSSLELGAVEQKAASLVDGSIVSVYGLAECALASDLPPETVVAVRRFRDFALFGFNYRPLNTLDDAIDYFNKVPVVEVPGGLVLQTAGSMLLNERYRIDLSEPPFMVTFRRPTDVPKGAENSNGSFTWQEEFPQGHTRIVLQNRTVQLSVDVVRGDFPDDVTTELGSQLIKNIMLDCSGTEWL